MCSDIILIAKAVKMGRTFIGWKYALFEPQDIIKGRMVSNTVTVRYGEPFIYVQEDPTRFEVGKSYVILFRKHSSDIPDVGGVFGYFSIENNDSIYFDGKLISLKEFPEIIRSVMKYYEDSSPKEEESKCP